MLKKIFVTIFVLFCVLCLGVNAWWFYISTLGTEKVVSTTFEVGLQETTDGNKKYFMEVNSYDNCFEVKFNYMLDENREAFFSQGLQYYNQSSNVSFDNYTLITETRSKKYFWGWKDTYYDYKNVLRADVGNTKRINYMSSNDYEYTQISTNPIDDDTFFKIQFQKDEKSEIYLMQMKGDILVSEKDVTVEMGMFHGDYATYYDVYDIDWLVGLVFLGMESMPYGTSCSTIFEFGDLFNYYEPDDSSDLGYSLVDHNKSKQIIDDIKSYFSIKIDKHEGNIQKASQSLFNCVDGSSNFNISGVSSVDYFYGRTAIDVSNDMFNPVLVGGNCIALKLKDSFIDKYEFYSDKIYLDILIDLDLYFVEGYKFIGFTDDSGLDKFNIHSCQSVQIIDNEEIYSEVIYDC